MSIFVIIQDRISKTRLAMKQFFKEHSYNMVKMFLNQFATSIFGLVLAYLLNLKKSYDSL